LELQLAGFYFSSLY